MTADELRDAVATEEGIRAHGFSVLAALAERIAGDGDDESRQMSEAREIAIRMLDHRDALGPHASALDAILRRTGLFPYLEPERLGTRDLLAVEAHRPLDMAEEDVVFHRVQADVYRRLMDGESVVLSAPTSFGKSLVIDALIASGRYRNVVVWCRRSR
jgi:ATP-dependent helicase YprA (DUF1998 family)